MLQLTVSRTEAELPSAIEPEVALMPSQAEAGRSRVDVHSTGPPMALSRTVQLAPSGTGSGQPLTRSTPGGSGGVVVGGAVVGGAVVGLRVGCPVGCCGLVGCVEVVGVGSSEVEGKPLSDGEAVVVGDPDSDLVDDGDSDPVGESVVFGMTSYDGSVVVTSGSD